MARKLPDHSRHIGSINYRCATMARQLEALRLASIEMALTGEDGDARASLRALRDQLDLLEAEMPEIGRGRVG